MELICNRRPRRATGLTVGKEYEGRMVTRDGENTENMDNASHFYCENDKDSTQRYSIELFIEPEVEEVIIPDITYDDVVAKLTYTLSINGDGDPSDDDNEIILIASYNGNQLFEIELSRWVNDSLSCGILAITDIGNITAHINILTVDHFKIEGFNLILSDQDLADLKQLIFKEFMTRLLINNQLNLSYTFAMISDNDYRSHIHWDTLDEMSITDNEENHGINPNSDNNIKFWVIPLPLVNNED